MAETSISKRCSKCKQIKPVSEFHKQWKWDTKLISQCKSCKNAYERAYRATEHGKAATKKYNNSEHGKATRAAIGKRYRNSSRGKAKRLTYSKSECGVQSQKKYDSSEKGKTRSRRRVVKTKIIYPEKMKARRVVRDAIRSGRLHKAKTSECVYCGEQARLWHHWAGYEKEHWFDIIPLCQRCDAQAHKTLIRKEA